MSCQMWCEMSCQMWCQLWCKMWLRHDNWLCYHKWLRLREGMCYDVYVMIYYDVYVMMDDYGGENEFVMTYTSCRMTTLWQMIVLSRTIVLIKNMSWHDWVMTNKCVISCTIESFQTYSRFKHMFTCGILFVSNICSLVEYSVRMVYVITIFVSAQLTHHDLCVLWLYSIRV